MKKFNFTHTLRQISTTPHNPRGALTWGDYLNPGDLLHPTDAGMRVIADMVVNLLQQTATGLALEPYGAADEALGREPLAEPMYLGAHC